MKLCLMYDITGAGIDYDSGPYPIMISAGQTTGVLNIGINDDNVLEDTERFSLSIRRSSLPTRVILSDPDETTVIIEDDDGK